MLTKKMTPDLSVSEARSGRHTGRSELSLDPVALAKAMRNGCDGFWYMIFPKTMFPMTRPSTDPEICSAVPIPVAGGTHPQNGGCEKAPVRRLPEGRSGL